MAYSLEKCSAYQIKQIEHKEIIIFDSHNMALPAWGTIRQNRELPLHLISFDTHADTRAAFAREIIKEYSVYDNFSCEKFKKLVLPMQEIKEISWKWIVFPIATVNMKNGELYKFIIFNKSRFEKWFQEYSH